MTEDALIAAIAAAPDALEPRVAYARWLIEQGDPLGMEALVGQEQRLLVRREAELFEMHREAWFGPLRRWLALVKLDVRWRSGFIDHITLWFDGSEPAPEMVSTILEHPSSRVIRSIYLSATGDAPAQPMIDALIELARPRSLRNLEIATQQGRHHADLSALWRAFPRIEMCRVVGMRVSFGAIEAPCLRELQLGLGGDTPEAIAAIDRARPPRLVNLSLEDATDATVEQLLATPIARQLETLKIPSGTVSPPVIERLRRLHAEGWFHGTLDV